jgi:hypothetical protein
MNKMTKKERDVKLQLLACLKQHNVFFNPADFDQWVDATVEELIDDDMVALQQAITRFTEACDGIRSMLNKGG